MDAEIEAVLANIDALRLDLRSLRMQQLQREYVFLVMCFVAIGCAKVVVLLKSKSLPHQLLLAVYLASIVEVIQYETKAHVFR
jgi:bacteriorhodopsin